MTTSLKHRLLSVLCLMAAMSAPAFAQIESGPEQAQPSRSGGILLRQGAAVGVDPDINTLGDRAGHALSVSLSPLALAGGAFLLLDNKRHPGQARGAVEGLAATGLMTVLLKRGINEQRPNGGGGSFPSGHASLAFAMATAVTEYHPRYKWLAYGTATAIAAARVEVDAHYWRDVVAGGALGLLTTKYFMRRHRGFTVTPRGVGFQKQF